MKRALLRALSTLLIITMLLGCISCYETDNTEYDEEQRLEITKESISYGEAFIEEANLRFYNVAVKLAEKISGKKLNDSQKAEIGQHFKKTIIPMLYRIRIYENEADRLLLALESYVSKDKNENTISILFAVYNECLRAVGSQRSGKITYTLAELYVSSLADTAYSRYEEYGYGWQLEDAERLSTLLDEVRQLGESKFISVLSMRAFIISLLQRQITSTTESVFTLTDKELLFLIEYQGKYFSEQGITGEDWRIFASIATEFIPENSATAENALLYALKKECYYAEVAEVMPSLTNLYASLGTMLRNDGKLPENSNGEICIKSILHSVLQCENELEVFLKSLEIHGKTSSDSERMAISEHGLTDEFNDFINETTVIDANGLISGLKELDSSNEYSEENLDRLIIAYLAGVAPYIAFMLSR